MLLGILYLKQLNLRRENYSLGLMLRMLKTGGRAAVRARRGAFGSSKAHKQIRQELIEKYKLML